MLAALLPSKSLANFIDAWLFDDGVNLHVSGTTELTSNDEGPDCYSYSGQGYVCYGTSYLAAAVIVEPPPPPCESMSVIDAAAVSEMLGSQPQPEPFERAARIFCNFGQVAVDSRYSSFPPPVGPWMPNTTDDPCRAFLNHVDALAGIHSHPFFENVAQYNAGVGCGGTQNWSSTPLDLEILNWVTNTDFSPYDRDWVVAHGIPLYMRNPLVNVDPYYFGQITRLERDPADPQEVLSPIVVWNW